jgi:hypothetical protein
MTDKEKLLKIKENVERLAKMYERDAEEIKGDQELNNIMLSMVNKELSALEEDSEA